MLASASAVVGGLFIGTQSEGRGADSASRTGVWSGALILELLSVVPFLCAVPALFHELAHSTLLHVRAPSAVDVALGPSELLPAFAILPFLLYQLTGFGTLNYLVSRHANWGINLGIAGLITAAYIANRTAAYDLERAFGSALILGMVMLVWYGIVRLKRMQADFDLRRPHKDDTDKA
jgi:hypothetical protein